MAIDNYLEREDLRNQFINELRNSRSNTAPANNGGGNNFSQRLREAGNAGLNNALFTFASLTGDMKNYDPSNPWQYKDTELGNKNNSGKEKKSNNPNIYHDRNAGRTNPYLQLIPSVDNDDILGSDVSEAQRAYDDEREEVASALESKVKDELGIKNHDDALSVVDEYVNYRIEDAGGFPYGDYPEELRQYVRHMLLKKVLQRNYGLKKGDKNYAPNVYGGIADYINNKRSANKTATEPEDEYVEIVIEPGDTFGQKIIDAGLATEHGLWGEDGDVAYYANQLRNNGALSDPNVVDYGQRFKLAKRK